MGEMYENGKYVGGWYTPYNPLYNIAIAKPPSEYSKTVQEFWANMTRCRSGVNRHYKGLRPVDTLENVIKWFADPVGNDGVAKAYVKMLETRQSPITSKMAEPEPITEVVHEKEKIDYSKITREISGY